jgi:hypothetical protein
MRFKVILILTLLLAIPVALVSAQSDEPELRLQLRRSFGFQGGDRIQGSFSLRVSGVDDLVRVGYLIDGQLLASITQEPFVATFSTGNYAPGEHLLHALASTADGRELESQRIRVTFITADLSWQSAGRIAAWILGGVLIIMLLGMFGTGFLAGDRAHFELGVYGAAGGAICRHCQLPFRRHILAPNLIVGKLERCPHCGRVAIVSRARREALAAAEERFRQDQMKGQFALQREEDDYRRRLDDSRFEG